jgi:hypothetical protein
MSESLLVVDISSWLQAHARGRQNAKPRDLLIEHLRSLGHTVTDRKMREIYAGMKDVGHSCSSPKGLYWIVTADDRQATTNQLHGRAMASLVREKEIRDAAPQGQGNLF